MSDSTRYQFSVIRKLRVCMSHHACMKFATSRYCLHDERGGKTLEPFARVVPRECKKYHILKLYTIFIIARATQSAHNALPEKSVIVHEHAFTSNCTKMCKANEIKVARLIGYDDGLWIVTWSHPTGSFTMNVRAYIFSSVEGVLIFPKNERTFSFWSRFSCGNWSLGCGGGGIFKNRNVRRTLVVNDP